MSRHRNQTARVEPVVTYSRLEEAARVRAGRRSDLLEIEPQEAFAAEEAPRSPEPPYIEDFVDEPRLRAVADDTDDRFADEPTLGEAKRPGSMRFILVTAVIAVIAGIGLVGASFSIATIDKDGTATAVASGEEAGAVLAPEADDAGPVLDLTPGVRKISTDGGSGSRGTIAPDADSSDVTAAEAIEPPTPRAKPERTASAAASESEAPADEPVVVAKTAPAPKADDSTDALIANIEKTLTEKRFEPAPLAPAAPQDQARLEDGVPMDAGPAPMDMGGQPTEIYPPAVAEYPPPAETAPVEVLPPPAVMTEAPRRPRLFERWFGWLRPNPPPPPPIGTEGLVAAEPLPPGVKLPPADIPSPLPTN